MRSLIITTLFAMMFVNVLFAESSADTTRVYTYDLLEDIGPDSWRKTQKAMKESEEWGADLIVIHMNTYGGLLNAADSIRTAIVNNPTPVWVFIDNNAASAGALISIAADTIFMKSGGSIGSATVVNQAGEPMPDKYQSYMRSLMRSTAESHGADTVISGGDTTVTWRRDPKIAEAMVDLDVEIPGISEKGKVLAFTTKEAIKHNYCDGEVKTMEEIYEKHVDKPYVVKKQKLTTIDLIIHFFINPVVQGLLVMMIIGGIYFELQTPGIGFAIAVSIIATVLYFVPLYLEGIAAHWEFLLFILGVGLIIFEIFVTPGFGVFGVLGGVCMISGLSLAMIDTLEFEYSPIFWSLLGKSVFMVTVLSTVSLFGSIWLGGKLFKSSRFSNLALNTTQRIDEGYIGIDTKIKSLKGKVGVAITDLRPSGSVEIEDNQYNAQAMHGYIEAGAKVKVLRDEMAQIYVKEIES